MSLRGGLAAVLTLVLVVWHTFGDLVFRIRYPMIGANPDAYGTLWMYQWVRDEVEAGRFPVSTDQMYAPEGMNFLVRNGANVLDALLSIPLQWLLGGGRAELWTCVVIVVGNALSFFPLARKLAPASTASAILCTAWWAANPFVLFELSGGRPTQALLWFVPPAVAALLRLQGYRDAMILGLCVGLQGLTYWYLPLFFAVVMGPTAILRSIREPGSLRYLSLAVGIALLLVAPVAIPIAQAASAGTIPGLDVTLETSGVWTESAERSRRLFSHLGMVSTLVPLLAVFSRWRSAPGLAIGVLLAVVFAVGARLSFSGQSLNNYPYQWLFEHSSLVARLNFPSRILSVVYCVGALSLVPVLAEARTRVLPVLFGALSLLEHRANKLAPTRSLSMPPLPASFIVAAHPGPILSVPMGAPEVAMVQQAFHGQVMVSGMGDHVESVRSPAYDVLLENLWFTELVQADERMRPWTRAEEAAIRKEVRWVWFDRALLARGLNSHLTDSIDTRLRMALGEPYYEDDYTVLWNLADTEARADEADKALAAAAEAEMDLEEERAKGGQERGVIWTWSMPE